MNHVVAEYCTKLGVVMYVIILLTVYVAIRITQNLVTVMVSALILGLYVEAARC